MPVLILHTTQGSWKSALATFASEPGKAPHVLIDPTTRSSKTYQPDFTKPSKSLKNLPGGVETNNRGGVVQVEIVGFVDNVPSYSDSWYQTLADMLLPICRMGNIPVKFPCSFVNPQRLSFDAWNAVEGIIGHCHVPENDHMDPGDISKLIPIMLGVDEMARINDLGQAGITLDQIYINKTGKPCPLDVRQSWGKDFEEKLKNGVDLQPTFEYIIWVMDGGK